MDLIYTDVQETDYGAKTWPELGVFHAYTLDLSFGKSENNFELALGVHEPLPKLGSLIYVENTEYGGIVDGVKVNSRNNSRVFVGRTWHSFLNNAVLYKSLTVTNVDANEAIELFLVEAGFSSTSYVIRPDSGKSGVRIESYTFPRFSRGYDGLVKMLEANGGKLKMRRDQYGVFLRAEPIVDYTAQPVDNDQLELKIEQHIGKVNHLICLGSGQGDNRDVLHLYLDDNGDHYSMSSPLYHDHRNRTEIYDYPNAQDSIELAESGWERLKELWSVDHVETEVYENAGFEFDIGDIVGGSDNKTGVSVVAPVTQKIVKIRNGIASISYKTGG